MVNMTIFSVCPEKLKKETFSILKAEKKIQEVEKNKMFPLVYIPYHPWPWLQPTYITHVAVVHLYLYKTPNAGSKKIEIIYSYTHTKL